jgi:hypothetical protein
VGRRKAGRRQRFVRFAPVREEEEDGRLEKKEKENGPRLGRKTGWTESEGKIPF